MRIKIIFIFYVTSLRPTQATVKFFVIVHVKSVPMQKDFTFSWSGPTISINSFVGPPAVPSFIDLKTRI